MCDHTPIDRRSLLRLLAAGAALPLLPFGAHAQTAATAAAPLDMALAAYRWLRRHAVHADGRVTWPVAPDTSPRGVMNMYSGTPGVVLFLLELHHQTGAEDALALARDAADAIAAALPAPGTAAFNAGLYTGVAGMGFVLDEVFRATGAARFRNAALAALRALHGAATPADGGVEWNDYTDIVYGNAGIGAYLLHMAARHDDSASIALAERAAHRLIRAGHTAEGGTFWYMRASDPRNAPNFSHGTAGVAWFLTELYRVTNKEVFLDAALAGTRYLDAVALRTADTYLVFHGKPATPDLYYYSWCHGPPGTARLFRSLALATGDAHWNERVVHGANAMMRSGIPERRLPGFWNNISFCCGDAGAGDFMLTLQRETRGPLYAAMVDRFVAQLDARATRDRDGAKWVQAENRISPDEVLAQTGLMQGAAGVGLFLLRVHALRSGRTQFVRLPDSPFNAA